MSPMSPLERIAKEFDGVPHEIVDVADGCPCLRVEREHLRMAILRLRDRCGFETNTFLTAVDNLPEAPRFEATYQFLSIQHSERVRLKVTVYENDCQLPTITDIFPGVAYLEREVFDLFGIRFGGDVEQKRLYMPEGYGHFPLRKDFPHRGIEPDKLYREWERRHAGGNTYRS